MYIVYKASGRSIASNAENLAKPPASSQSFLTQEVTLIRQKWTTPLPKTGVVKMLIAQVPPQIWDTYIRVHNVS
eukprot:1161564-Pelagomonas_calceolata.AAC.8